MRIIVCVKQVPETTEVQIDPESGTLMREGISATLNPFDTYALEEALRLRERYGGEVTALSMGPPQAEAVLKDSIALGCDRGILLSDRAYAGSDTLATSVALASAIRRIGAFDLLLCGLKTTDGDTGQVGPGLAEELGIPHISYVRRIVEVNERHITVERTLDELLQVLSSPMPCLLTVTKEINEPRLPSFKGKMAARKAQVPVWRPSDLDVDTSRLGADGSPTRVVKVFHPTTNRVGEMIAGDPETQARVLVNKLREMNLL